jgi:lipoic acid synthetase
VRRRLPAKTRELKDLMDRLDLHTVCEVRPAPTSVNAGTAVRRAFMILGNVCATLWVLRGAEGDPARVDYDEPRRVAEAAALMGLRHAVVPA